MRKRFQGFYVIITFFTCLVAGTLGYSIIEGWDLLESLYMTVITITTVGFHEENPLSPTGKIFTIFLIFFGFGVTVFTISNITSLVFSGEIFNWVRRHFMNAKIELFKNHFILCGYGRMGRVVAKQLELKNIPFVIIETQEDKAPKQADQTHPVIIGNSGEESVLMHAGINNAACLISVVSTDAENAFTVMTARRLNKNLHIVSRCFNSTSEEKIKLAGANQVISPYQISGNRLTQAALHPTMVEFVQFIEDIDEKGIEMADILVPEGSRFVGQLLSDKVFHDVGVMIVGIKKDDGEFYFHPRGDTKIEALDHLVVVGPDEKVGRLADIVGS